MRKITEQAVKAFMNGESKSFGNTIVEHLIQPHMTSTHLYLHGNLIASLSNNVLTLSSCGRETNTTKERLNGLLAGLDHVIKQEKGTWYLYDLRDYGEIKTLFKDGMTIKVS